jgi:amphiphysin
MKEARASLHGDLEQIERLVVAPSMDFIVILDQIKKAITKRNNKEIDYYRHGETIKQLNEKNRTINDEKKLAQTSLLYEEAKRAYLDIDARLKDDLKVFLSKKKEFIEPCLLTFYNYQIRVHQTLYNVFYDIASAKFDLKTSALDGYQTQKDRLSALLGQFTLCIPANINAERISHVNESTASGSSSPVRPPPPVPLSHAETSRKLFVIALYDYTAQAEGDLSFKKDDKIEVLERKDDVNDWWVGRCGTIVGQFPGNYVQEL